MSESASVTVSGTADQNPVAGSSTDPQCAELRIDERCYNLLQTEAQTKNFSRLRNRIERQLGGDLDDPGVHGKLSLLIYRKVNALTQEVRELKDLIKCLPIQRNQAVPIDIIRTEEAYHDFVELIKDPTSKENVVSFDESLIDLT
ncbi:MAG: hypothetical protein AAGK05_08365 [Pseudomonadota bacterium]